MPPLFLSSLNRKKIHYYIKICTKNSSNCKEIRNSNRHKNNRKQKINIALVYFFLISFRFDLWGHKFTYLPWYSHQSFSRFREFKTRLLFKLRGFSCISLVYSQNNLKKASPFTLPETLSQSLLW